MPRPSCLRALVALTGFTACHASASTVRLSYRLSSDSETPAPAILDDRAAAGEANDLSIELRLISQTTGPERAPRAPLG